VTRINSAGTRWWYPASAVAFLAIGAALLAHLAGAPGREPIPNEQPPGFDSPGEAMEWILMSYRDERGQIPRDGLLRARAQAAAMRGDSMQKTQAADAVGMPTATAGITRGAWDWIGPTNIGGRVRALVLLNASTILTGGVAGGVWKSTNAGATWRVIDDFLANLAVSTIVSRPGQSHVLYAGTGEGFFNADSIRGAGIFLSTNEGESWSQLPSTANVDFDFVNRLAFSADGNTLLAATRTGLFRSTDSGNSWVRVLTTTNMLDVKFLAGSSSQVVASGRGRNAFFSSNGGQTWGVSGGLTPTGTAIRVELAVSASSPNIVYASVEETSGQIWKSTDSGVTFAKVGDPAHLSTQGWYDNVIWVDPTNPDHVVAGGVSLFRSTNGGANFSTISSCHVDQHAIVHDPGYNGTTNRRVYFGSDGGVCRMDDVGVNLVTSLRNGLGITQFYGAGGNAGAGRIMGGTQDNGTLRYDVGAGSNVWATQFGSDGGFSAVDPTDANVLYGETQNFRIHRSLTGGTPSQFIYGGTGATSCSKPVPYQITDACNGTANFISPFILDPNEPNRLLAGGRSLWRSNDPKATNTATTGPSWSAIKLPTLTNSNISAIAVAPGNSNLVWVGHNSGEVGTTVNGLDAAPIWSAVDAGIPNRVVNSIAIDPADSRIVYVALGGFTGDNLWKTINGGATWQDATGSGGSGLPDVPVRSIVLHPTVRDWLYAATDVGVFASENGGESWSLPHEGPANVAVFQLFWMDTTLVAVTHGRGMYTAVAGSIRPVFARRPQSQGVVSGHSVTFNVAALGAGPFEFQWYRGSTGDTSNPIAGATSTSYNTGPLKQTASYWVRLTSPFGTTDSNTATLTILPWVTLLTGNTVQGSQPNGGGSTIGKTSSTMPAGPFDQTASYSPPLVSSLPATKRATTMSSAPSLMAGVSPVSTGTGAPFQAPGITAALSTSTSLPASLQAAPTIASMYSWSGRTPAVPGEAASIVAAAAPSPAVNGHVAAAFAPALVSVEVISGQSRVKPQSGGLAASPYASSPTAEPESDARAIQRPAQPVARRVEASRADVDRIATSTAANPTRPGPDQTPLNRVPLPVVLAIVLVAAGFVVMRRKR
jgi:hypothetical protein